MSSIIITSHDVLKTLQIGINRKSQKENNCYNYFFTPNVSIRIYKPLISVVNKDYIVFKFDKYRNSGMYHLIEDINKRLYSVVESNYNIEGIQRDNILLVNENFVYLKAHLPHKNSKYFISVHNKDTDKLSGTFWLPNANAVYDEVVLDIRNVWQYRNKLGYRLELKYVSL